MSAHLTQPVKDALEQIMQGDKDIYIIPAENQKPQLFMNNIARALRLRGVECYGATDFETVYIQVVK